MTANTALPLSPTVLATLPNPCYVMDRALLNRNLDILARVREEAGVEIILALKGFAMWKAFPFLREKGFTRATASSLNEARLAFEEMGTPAYTYTPAYTQEDISEIARLSSHLTFNSLNQLSRWTETARKANGTLSTGLRVNPEISSVGTDLYNPCVPGSRLGVRVCDLPDPQTLCQGSAPVNGFHCHALCESDAESSCNLIDRFEERFASYIPFLKWVNFGGGHLMTRQGYDLPRLIARLKAFRQKWPHLHVILEPGAAFVWETGYLLARVEDVVHNGGETPVAIMNVSFTAHMPDCLEMPYMAKIHGAIHEGQTPAPDAEAYPYRYRLGGNSCLAGDYMGDWWFGKPLEAGSLLLFNDMIHYTFVKTTMFNGVHHPALCIVEGDRILFRRDFTYPDFRARLS